MKKVFLLFGIAAFTSASAQQKDVFDIQKHLVKIVKDKKFPGAVTRPSKKSNYFLYQIVQPRIWGPPASIYILSNGDKVYTLSCDNMPCVVPDMKQFTNMPNISNSIRYFESLPFKQHLPGSIPNAVVPYRLIASE